MKKLITLTLATVFVTSSLAGCQSTKSTTQTLPVANNQTDTVPPEDSSAFAMVYALANCSIVANLISKRAGIAGETEVAENFSETAVSSLQAAVNINMSNFGMSKAEATEEVIQYMLDANKTFENTTDEQLGGFYMKYKLDEVGYTCWQLSQLLEEIEDKQKRN
ncbi:hypothetical protein [Vibrio sp. FJH11]